MAVAARRSTRPAPGRPRGNVENSRCKAGPRDRLRRSARARPPQKPVADTPLSRGWLEVDDSAFQTDGDGVRPIVCGELGEDVLDVALDGLFSDGELGGD